MFEDAAEGLELEKPLEVLDLVELLERAVRLPVTPVDSATPWRSAPSPATALHRRWQWLGRRPPSATAGL